MDIAELILVQHHEQRRQFAILDEIPPHATDTLAALWHRLKALLEVHAAAEERYFYPELLRLGKGAPGTAQGPEGETKDAIKDHNEIRDAIREADAHPVGSEPWRAGVRAAREANSDHMAEEERDDLADIRRHADLDLRHRIALSVIAFEALHWAGVEPVDRDADRYVADHT